MKNTIFGGIALGLAFLGSAVVAETCGGQYVVQRGDTLSGISNELYDNARMWTLIYSANRQRLGDDPNNIPAGVRVTLNCIDGLPKNLPGGRQVETVAKAPAKPQSTSAALPRPSDSARKIAVVTGTDFAPFTDKDLPGGGMLAEVVRAAMEAAAPEQGFDIYWVDDWSAHFEPLLSNAFLDLSFPWFKPDCASDPETYRCANLDFSTPMFEVLTLLFVANDNPISFNSDADMQGKTLCRPAGYATYMFDQDGRNWLREGIITHVAPPAVDDCFRMLMAGEADAVVLNEFLGRKKLKELDLVDQVSVALGKPISIETNHVVVHKDHPNGAELMDVFDAGLEKIRADGTYQQIVDTHMTRVWQEF